MSTRLYVGNLSYTSTKDSLKAAFSQNGREVTDVHIVLDRETGQSRGFAFITLATDSMATAAITEMNGAVVDGRPLRVNEAGERPPRPAGTGGGFQGARPGASASSGGYGGGGSYSGGGGGGGGYGAGAPTAGAPPGGPPAGAGGRRGGRDKDKKDWDGERGGGGGGAGRKGGRGGGGNGGGERERW